MERNDIRAGGRMPPGTRVEVRSRFDATWASGFVVADAQPTGYFVRRVSDGAVLPSQFVADDLRPASR